MTVIEGMEGEPKMGDRMGIGGEPNDGDWSAKVLKWTALAVAVSVGLSMLLVAGRLIGCW